MKKRCVAYCRVSTKSDDQLNSLENQQSYFQRVISQNPELEFVHIYADRGVSGTKLSRPEFDQMLKDAGLDVVEVRNATKDGRKPFVKYTTAISSVRKPAFDVIMVKDLSRFARNVLSEGILRDLRQNGVFVHFVEANLSTERETDISIIQILATITERESRDRSVKVLFGVKEGAKRGKITTHPKIYGYNYIRAENRLEIVPDEAEVIRQIFDMYAAGEGIRRILKYLSGSGIRTREGKEFCKSSIARILDQDKYAGISIRRKWTNGLVFAKISPKVRERKDWIVQGETEKVPPIITQEQFDLCRQMRDERCDKTAQKGVYKGITRYAGLIVCGVCGKPYHSNVDKGRRFYNCSGKRQRGTGACANRNLKLSTIEKVLTADTLDEMLDGAKMAALKTIKEDLKASAALLEASPVAEIARVKAELSEVQAESLRLATAYTKGRISDSQLDILKPDIDGRAAALEAELAELTKPREEILKRLQGMKEAMIELNEMNLQDSYTADELAAMVRRITVYPDYLTIDVKLHANITEATITVREIVKEVG